MTSKSFALTVAAMMLLQGCASYQPESVLRKQGEGTYHYSNWSGKPSEAYDIPPRPVGGMSRFVARLSYPRELRRKQIGGEIIVQITIDSNGSVAKAHIHKSVHPLLDQIVLNAVHQTRWQPAVKNHTPIRATIRLPVNFQAPGSLPVTISEPLG
jgi:TonB family protein